MRPHENGGSKSCEEVRGGSISTRIANGLLNCQATYIADKREHSVASKRVFAWLRISL
ncbi:hypothetical protein ACVWZM_001827 [Bradyrhizobium sp. USDA 4501]